MPIRKTRRMREIEDSYRQPIEKVLANLYVSLGTLQAVANALHVDIATVWHWMYKFNLPRRQWVVPTAKETQGAKE